MLSWITDEGIILDKHIKSAFSKHDSINVPAGKVAILSRDGDFSEVYREGDKPILGNRLLPQKGILYMIDIQPSKAVGWGFGNVQCGNRCCGINGFLRLQVVSPRKFLIAYASQPLPLTIEKLASLWIQKLGDDIRNAAFALGKNNLPVAELPSRIAKNTTDSLSEALEEKGLLLYELNIEPLFFRDIEDSEE